MWRALRWVALGFAVLAAIALLVPATVGFASLLVLFALLALVTRLLTVPEPRDCFGADGRAPPANDRSRLRPQIASNANVRCGGQIPPCSDSSLAAAPRLRAERPRRQEQSANIAACRSPRNQK